MIGISIANSLGFTGPSVLPDASSQAYFAATGITGATQQAAIDNLVKGLKTDGIWSKMKAVYPFVTDNRNLLSYTEDFSNSYWFKANGSSVTSNSTIAPNGTLTADTLNVSTTAYSTIYNQNLFGFVNGVYTQTIYAKKSTKNWLYILDLAGSGAKAWFNLDTGVVGTVAIGYTASMESVGNGWYRCLLSQNSNPALYYQFGASDADNSFTPSSSGSIYIWGAQLVEGTSALDYQRTETRLNIPRLDYSNGTCPSLLVEPQRTNRVLYSSSFDNAAWDKGPYNTIVANAIVSPDGTQNADKIQSSVSGTQVRYTNQAISSATGTYSIYMKAGEQTQCLMYLGGAADGIFWNLTNGNFISYYGSGSVITSYSSEDVGNGWFRYTITSSSGISFAEVYMSVNQVVGSNIPVGNGFYIWGAQVEVGSYATSYIPTTSASVTRNADVISKTGISSLIGQTEGTLFVDAYIDIQNEDLSPVVGLFALNNNASNLNNCIVIGIDRPASGTSNQIYGFVINGGTDQAILNSSNITAGRHKIAFAYKANDFVLYVNGVLIGSDTSGSVPTLSQALIGSRYNGDTYFLGDEVNAAALWKTRLTNTQLAQLTTI